MSPVARLSHNKPTRQVFFSSQLANAADTTDAKADANAAETNSHDNMSTTTASHLLALLDEPNHTLKAHALNLLHHAVPNHWPEIADALPNIEALHEDDAFPQSHLAALVAAKTYYYLNELPDALLFALGAGPAFDVDEPSEFVDAVLTHAIDEYCALHQKRAEAERAAASSSGTTTAAAAPRD